MTEFLQSPDIGLLKLIKKISGQHRAAATNCIVQKVHASQWIEAEFPVHELLMLTLLGFRKRRERLSLKLFWAHLVKVSAKKCN